MHNERIDELEAEMIKGDLVDCPLSHMFTDGMYIRQIFMPAGSLIVSKIHKTQHPFTISKGKAAVKVNEEEWSLLEAPYTSITQPGTRRVLYILEDCVWTTYHPLDDIKFDYNDMTEEEKLRIVDDIENRIIEPHINSITGTNINDDYKRLLNEIKMLDI